MKIFLLGYMGSGKSLIAQYLAKNLNFTPLDLDDHISLIEEKTIPEIFSSMGELYFRRLETKVLVDVLEEPTSMVVALGGGTPVYGNNLQLIKDTPNVKVVYLKASVGFLTRRLYTEADNRPVISHLKKIEELEDFIRKHLFERNYYYNQADIIVNVEDKTPEAITEEIKTALQ